MASSSPAAPDSQPPLSPITRFATECRDVSIPFTQWLLNLQERDTSHDLDPVPRAKQLLDRADEYHRNGDIASYSKAVSEAADLLSKHEEKRKSRLEEEETVKQAACEHFKALHACFRLFVGEDALKACLSQSEVVVTERHESSLSSILSAPKISQGETALDDKEASDEFDHGSSYQASLRSSSQHNTPRPSSKRQRISSPLNPPPVTPRPAKRQNIDVHDNEYGMTVATPPRLIATQFKEIEFDDVYQGGLAEIKYIILHQSLGLQKFKFKLPRLDCQGFWILRCDEHNLHYSKPLPPERTLRAAATHLGSSLHEGCSGSYSNALDTFGVRVRNCTLEKAVMNNEAVNNAFEDGYEALTYWTPVRSKIQCKIASAPADFMRNTSRHASWDGSHDSSLEESSEYDPPYHIPIPGHLYLAYWDGDDAASDTDSEPCYAAICLPTDTKNFSSVGLRGISLKSTKLLDDVPRCYAYDPFLERITGWSSGYGDLGRRVSKRKYPFILIDSERTVNNCQVAWISVQDIKPFEDDGFDERFQGTLLTYLKCNFLCPNTPQSLRRMVQPIFDSKRREEESTSIDEQSDEPDAIDETDQPAPSQLADDDTTQGNGLLTEVGEDTDQNMANNLGNYITVDHDHGRHDGEEHEAPSTPALGGRAQSQDVSPSRYPGLAEVAGASRARIGTPTLATPASAIVVKKDDSDDNEIFVRRSWRSVEGPGSSRASRIVICDSDSDTPIPEPEHLSQGSVRTTAPAPSAPSASAPVSRPASRVSGGMGGRATLSPSAKSDTQKNQGQTHHHWLKDWWGQSTFNADLKNDFP